MNELTLELSHIRNISNGKLTLPICKGIYCLAGRNGTGKSTIMSCLAQSIYASSLNILDTADYNEDSYVKFSYNNHTTT